MPEWAPHIRSRLTALRLSPVRENEIVEELSQHLDDRWQELVNGGMSEDQAAHAALASFTDLETLALSLGRLRQAHVPPPHISGLDTDGRWLGLWHDLRYAARRLAHARLFTATTIAALVIGLSGAITMVTMIYGVYFRALPFTAPDRIVALATRNLSGGTDERRGLSRADLEELQSSSRLFDGIAVADEDVMDVTDASHAAERYTGAWISANAFSLIGQHPTRGREFTRDDDRVGAPAVVILSDDLWRRHYGAAADAVGATLRVNGVPSTVIGVMPPGFGFPQRAALWQPLASRPRDEARDSRDLDVFGRLKAGVTNTQAEDEITRVMTPLAARAAANEKVAFSVRPFQELTTGGQLRVALTGLTIAALLLLLIACANVGNLLLARGASRAEAIAVQMSLGATRRRIVGELLAEVVLLTTAAGAVGLGLAAVIVRAIDSRLPDTVPYWLHFSVAPAVVAMVLAVCLGATLACGLAPALQAGRAELTTVLGAVRRAGGGRRARRWTDVLVATQLALSFTLLTAGGLMLRNVRALSTVDAGVDTTRLITAQVALPDRTYATDEQRRGFYRRLTERLSSVPGMRAGITSAVPGRPGFARQLAGDSGREATRSVSAVVVGPGYLETLGVVPVTGRFFAAGDTSTSHVTVVNERLAEVMFPGQSAVGRTISLAPESGDAGADAPLTIVGVVPNISQGGARGPQASARRAAAAVLYLPYESSPLPATTILVRSDADTGTVAAALRSAVGALDPDLPLTGIVRVDEAANEELGVLAIVSIVFALFACAALALATVGLYGITAFGVTQRVRELGVRRVLGADGRQVWWLVNRRAVKQLGAGLSLGLLGALGVGQVLQAALAGVSSRDPLTLIGIPVLMTVIVLAACVPPALRAIRLEPIAALRTE